MTLLNFLGPRLTTASVVVPPEPPAEEPLRLTRGLMARDRNRMTTSASGFTVPNRLGELVVAGVGGSVALEFTVSSVLTYSGGVASLNPTGVAALVDDLDWAQSLGIRALLRPMYGYYAPASVKTAAGGAMTWYTNDGSAGTGTPAPSNGTWKQMPNGMLRWWTTAATDIYLEFLSLLMAETDISEHPAVAGICFAGTMTQYAEPDQKQFALLENRQTVLAVMAGATTAEKAAAYNAADELATIDGYTGHRDIVSPKGIATYVSYNNNQFLNSTGGMGTSWQQSVFYMEEQVRLLGRMAVLENNSFQNPLFFQPQMYAHQLAQRDRTAPFPVPLHYQTRTNVKLEAAWDSQPVGGKITTPFSTVDLALERRANSVELANSSEKRSVTPTGVERWPAMSDAEAAAYNAAFRTVGLYV